MEQDEFRTATKRCSEQSTAPNAGIAFWFQCGHHWPGVGSFGELGTCLCDNSSYSQPVSTIKDIETAVRKLSRDELSAFRNWFLEFDAEAWDRQFEQDVQAGRLDRLADEALDELREGRCTDL